MDKKIFEWKILVLVPHTPPQAGWMINEKWVNTLTPHLASSEMNRWMNEWSKDEWMDGWGAWNKWYNHGHISRIGVRVRGRNCLHGAGGSSQTLEMRFKLKTTHAYITGEVMYLFIAKNWWTRLFPSDSVVKMFRVIKVVKKCFVSLRLKKKMFRVIKINISYVTVT